MNKYTLKLIQRYAFVAAVLAGSAWAHSAPMTQAAVPYLVPDTGVYTYESAIVEQEYNLIVSVPAGYDSGEGQEYPVIYVLDGQWNATIVKDIVGKSGFDGMVPPAIVVAITWAGAEPDYRFLRFRDLTPVALPSVPGSGQAESFLEAIADEMVPFVQERYRTSDKRVLMGSSLGGVFATYALLQMPELFDAIVATAAPYSGLGEGYFEGLVARLSGGSELFGKRAYLAVGSLGPNRPQVTALGALLADSGLEGARIRTVVVPGVGHAGIEPIGYTQGLQFAFRRPRLRLRRRLLRQYEGEYLSVDDPDEPPVRIELQGHRLAVPQVIDDRQLYASSQTTFYLEGINFEISFVRQNGAMSMTVYFGGNPREFVRVE